MPLQRVWQLSSLATPQHQSLVMPTLPLLVSQAADTYVLDPDMAKQLRQSNPQAFRNVLSRCVEAAGRGLWAPKPEVLEQLRKLYGELDDELEGVV